MIFFYVDHDHHAFPDNYNIFQDDFSIINEIASLGDYQDYILRKDPAFHTYTTIGGAFEYIDYGDGSLTDVTNIGVNVPLLQDGTKKELREAFIRIRNNPNLWIGGPSGHCPGYFEFICNLDTPSWGVSPDACEDAHTQYGIITDDWGYFVRVDRSRWQFWINYLCSAGHLVDADGIPMFHWVGYESDINAAGYGDNDIVFHPGSNSYEFMPGGVGESPMLPNVAWLIGHFTVEWYNKFKKHYPNILH